MSKLTWELLGDRILIKPDTAEAKTKKGIILPEASQEAPPTGEVVKVGPGFDQPINDNITKGATVMYGINAGSPVVLDGEKYLIMREMEIFMYGIGD